MQRFFSSMYRDQKLEVITLKKMLAGCCGKEKDGETGMAGDRQELRAARDLLKIIDRVQHTDRIRNRYAYVKTREGDATD